MHTHTQIYHYGVSEQESSDIITFNAVCLPPNFTMEYCEDEACLSNATVAPGKMHTFTLHLDTKKCSSSDGCVDPASVEFPTTHPYRHGHNGTRYSYLMASDRGCNVPYRDVVKVLVCVCVCVCWFVYVCVCVCVCVCMCVTSSSGGTFTPSPFLSNSFLHYIPPLSSHYSSSLPLSPSFPPSMTQEDNHARCGIHMASSVNPSLFLVSATTLGPREKKTMDMF